MFWLRNKKNNFTHLFFFRYLEDGCLEYFHQLFDSYCHSDSDMDHVSKSQKNFLIESEMVLLSTHSHAVTYIRVAGKRKLQ